jgi:2-phospho-L-lactate guanylyltransferase (CobY/MobA/RfbA family)
VNAKESLEVLLKSNNLKFGAKAFVMKLLNRLNANITALRLLLPADDLKILDEQMLDPEVSAQMDNIKSMLADLPKLKRDEIERYIECQHRVYKN